MVVRQLLASGKSVVMTGCFAARREADGAAPSQAFCHAGASTEARIAAHEASHVTATDCRLRAQRPGRWCHRPTLCSKRNPGGCCRQTDRSRTMSRARRSLPSRRTTRCWSMPSRTRHGAGWRFPESRRSRPASCATMPRPAWRRDHREHDQKLPPHFDNGSRFVIEAAAAAGYLRAYRRPKPHRRKVLACRGTLGS